jgi:hypothetical protein
MPPTGETIAAMTANNVTFARHEIARRKTFHPSADALDHADKFMPDDHRHRDRLLRPGVPVVNVDIGPADRSFPDPDEHVVVAHFRHRHFLEPKPGFRLAFDQRLHRRLHARKLCESDRNEMRK